MSLLEGFLQLVSEGRPEEAGLVFCLSFAKPQDDACTFLNHQMRKSVLAVSVKMDILYKVGSNSKSENKRLELY